MTTREYEEMIAERDNFIAELQAEIARLKAEMVNCAPIQPSKGRGAMNNWVYLLIAPAIFCVVMTVYHLVTYFGYERKVRTLRAGIEENDRKLRELLSELHSATQK